MINVADARTAIGFYEQAVALDPRYARAYASLAITWTTLAGTFLSGEEQRQAYVKARAAADGALRQHLGLAGLDPCGCRPTRRSGAIRTPGCRPGARQPVHCRRACHHPDSA